MPSSTPPTDEPAFSHPLKERIWHIIFMADTKASKAFDVILLWMIGASVVTVMLESVESLRSQYAQVFFVLEWTFTIIFTVEYFVRLWIVRRKRRYLFSFFGIVDFLAILPTYLAIFLAGSQYLMIVRILRLLRMFRVLKMARHIGDANLLANALAHSRSKIAVFLFGVLTIVSIEGTLMYLVESSHPETGFTSIPQSIYWGIVTITTVGYGDISPVTVFGKFLASIIMLTGFAIIAVPTGIVTAELGREFRRIAMDERICDRCAHVGHDPNANYCKECGEKLNEKTKAAELQ